MPGGFINGGFNIGRTMFPVPFGSFTGILDLYPGAAAAYSLEPLAADTTNVVRVRRSSDDTEQDFTAAQVSDGTLTTFTGAGDGFVETWYDQSGNARHATQATAASQPQIVDGGALVTGGIDFGELNSGLEATVPYQNGTITAIAKNNNAGATSRYIYNGAALSSSSAAHLLGSRSNGLNLLFQGGPVSAGTISDTQNLWYGDFATTDVLRINGAEVASGNAGSNSFLDDKLSIGGPLSRSWDGQINALILWPTSQSSNRAAIEANLADQYGITLA